MTATEAMVPKFGINQFFSARDARIDRWRTLNRITRTLAARPAHNGDWVGLARIVQRISSALLSNSYRDNREAWIIEDEGESHRPDFLPPSLVQINSNNTRSDMVITPDTIAFMRELDGKEIHGYNAARGLELLKPEALEALRRKTG
ncbi:hypothetical protein AB4156_33555 [Cupriavidus sp. 2MCAB6]|uniref:hypothetical protein n=1 Tax=Cupriavidus sp. 2MCAB6 TaxID=3232981 RepID=UPI003F93EF48